MKIKIKEPAERLAVYITDKLYIGVFTYDEVYEIPDPIGSYLLNNFEGVFEEVEE